MKEDEIIYLDTYVLQKDMRIRLPKSILENLQVEKGISRFDTDTALDNIVAQHYYEKNDFIREGVTRSYYKGTGR